MENLFFFLATSLVLRIPAPRFRRYLIGQSGCSCLLFATGKTLHIKNTADGDRIYFNDHTVGAVTYGFVCVQMRELYTLPQAEIILIQYINKMRKPLDIAYNICMEVNKGASRITISDYWQDNTGVDWKIKGLTNGKTVAVMYVKNIADAVVKEHDAFLNGFRFSS